MTVIFLSLLFGLFPLSLTLPKPLLALSTPIHSPYPLIPCTH
jgi:hypothetical protein